MGEGSGMPFGQVDEARAPADEAVVEFEEPAGEAGTESADAIGEPGQPANDLPVDQQAVGTASDEPQEAVPAPLGESREAVSAPLDESREAVPAPLDESREAVPAPLDELEGTSLPKTEGGAEEERFEAGPTSEAAVQQPDSHGEPLHPVEDSGAQPQYAFPPVVDASGADLADARPEAVLLDVDPGASSEPMDSRSGHGAQESTAPQSEPENPPDVIGAPTADESASSPTASPTDVLTNGAEAEGPSGRKTRLQLLEREGEVAADFLERLLDIADLDGDIDVDVDGDRAAVAVVDSEEGRVPRRLVGPDGRVLEALQELTRLAVQTATGERSRLMLDVGGFRAERRSALVNLARAAIVEVKESGQHKALADMTAFERKVVHDEVTAAGLVSESEGVEPNRHIVILPSS